MSMLSNAEKSNERPGLDPRGIVRLMNFTSVAEQSSQGSVSGGITGSARKGIKCKLDNNSLDLKYEVFIPIPFSVETV